MQHNNNRLRILVIAPNDYERLAISEPKLRENYEFLLTDGYEKSYQNPDYDVIDVMERMVSEFRDRIDGVLGTNEEFGYLMTSYVCERLRLTAPAFCTVIRMSHKFFSRKLQRNSLKISYKNSIPDFALVRCRNIVKPKNLEYPFFVKPVKGLLSIFAKMVHTDKELRRACDSKLLKDLHNSVYKPLEQMLAFCQIPDTSLLTFVAEQPLYGRQVTVDGFVTSSGKVTVMGIVDSVMYPGSALCFERFEYPSTLNPDIQQRMRDITTDMISGINGFKSTCFNVEFMYKADKDLCSVIEINPRLSYQFSDFYERVDGIGTFELQLKLSTDTFTEDCWRPKSGYANFAVSFALRRFTDALVEKIPTDEQVRKIKRNFRQVTAVVPKCEEGKRLSDVSQDTQSFRYAVLTMAGQTRNELFEIFEKVKNLLPFKFKEF